VSGSAAISQAAGQGGRRAAVLVASVGIHAAMVVALALLGHRAVLLDAPSHAVDMVFEDTAPAREAAASQAVEPTPGPPPDPADTAAPPLAPAPPPMAAAAPPVEPVPMAQPVEPAQGSRESGIARPALARPPLHHPAPVRSVARSAPANEPTPAPAFAQPAAPQKMAAPTTPAATVALPGPAAISAQWQGSLAAWIRARKQYPDGARRLGQEGGVLLRFTVLPDGAVREPQVLHGSGSTALDEAALTMIRAGHLPPFPPEMSQPQVTVTVPVRYRLED